MNSSKLSYHIMDIILNPQQVDMQKIRLNNTLYLRGFRMMIKSNDGAAAKSL